MISEITLGVGEASIDNDFEEILPSASIAGTVVDDTGAPIEGVTITLTGTDANGNTVSIETETDENGDYLFDDLIAGTYTVTETQPAAFDDGDDTPGSTGGDNTTNDVISDIELGPGEDSIDNDFEEILPSASIAGTVIDDTGAPIEGVTITLTGTCLLYTSPSPRDRG